MRLIDQGAPIAAPLEAQFLAERADCLVHRRFAEIFVAFEQADIEGDAEIVVGMPRPRIGDHVAGFGAALRVQGILFGIAAQAADDLDREAVLARLEVERPRVGLHPRMQFSDDLLAARAGQIAEFGKADIGRRAAVDDALVDRTPSLRPRAPVHLDAKLELHRPYHFLDLHRTLPASVARRAYT